MHTLYDLIAESLYRAEIERENKKRLASLPVYNVQFIPCGHVIQIKHNTSLEYKAIKAELSGRIDAICQHSDFCPICGSYDNPEVNSN